MNTPQNEFFTFSDADFQNTYLKDPEITSHMEDFLKKMNWFHRNNHINVSTNEFCDIEHLLYIIHSNDITFNPHTPVIHFDKLNNVLKNLEAGYPHMIHRLSEICETINRKVHNVLSEK